MTLESNRFHGRVAVHMHRIVHLVAATPGEHFAVSSGKYLQPVALWAVIEHRDHEPAPVSNRSLERTDSAGRWETLEALPASVGSVETLMLTCQREYDVCTLPETALYEST